MKINFPEDQFPRIMCAANSLPDLHVLYVTSKRVRQLIVNSFKFSFLIIIFNLKNQMENVYFDELGCYFFESQLKDD